MKKKDVELIPCWMEEPFSLEDWLAWVIGPGNIVDFSPKQPFNDQMTKLIKEITHHEEELKMNPRRSGPSSPIDGVPLSSPLNSRLLTRGEFGHIIESFEKWVEDNRDNLRQTDQTQVQRLIRELLDNLRSDENFEKLTKEEFLDNVAKLIDQPSQAERNYGRLVKVAADSVIKGVVFFVMAWALQTIYK